MKEISDILKAYQQAVKENKRAALATVVNVEGSSYRRPGARMLITDDGQLTGAISGGCLEGDALRKALAAIHQQENKLVRYDTTDEDDANFGVQLGCNGIVHILFEPIVEAHELNPVKILRELEGKRENAVLTVLYSLQYKKQIGTHMLVRKNHPVLFAQQAVNEQLLETANAVLESKTSTSAEFAMEDEKVQALVEFISPPIALVIAGAGNDAQPLAEIAYLLGWQVTVADGRPTHATAQRFSKANKILIAKPAQLLPLVEMDAQTAFVLMTHNYNYDLELLRLLLPTQASYIGILGPKSKLIRILDELVVNTAENQRRIHGPIGLDIAAETADEIAISIVAEIKAVLSGAAGGQLKEKKQKIHYQEGNFPLMDTAIIILAAGNSSRLGRPKQLLAYKDKPLLQVVSDAALQTAFRPVTVVLGAYKNEIAEQINGTLNYVINDHWQKGMASSIAAGLAVTLELAPDLERVIIAVSDQAFISQEIFEQLYQRQQLSGKGIVAAQYGETAGTPVLFRKKYFAGLLSLKGDSGAKSILKTYPEDIATITFEKGEMDIDTEEDYKKLIERS